MTPPPPLYQACVPVLLRYLGGLQRVVEAVAALGEPRCHTALQARLAADMFPLADQVLTAAHLALRCACPLAGLPVPPFERVDARAEALIARIVQVRAQLEGLDPDAFATADGRTIHERAGEAAIAWPASRFLFEFAMPNVLFHVTMAYAIARSQGAALGKGSFDGIHVYGGPMPPARQATQSS